MFKSNFYISVFLLLAATRGFAGSGFYFGADGISHEVRTHVSLDQVFSAPPPDSVSVSDASSDTFTDPGLRLGFKHKRRLNHSFFMSPELLLSQLDDDFIYGTNFKIGADIKNFSVYGIGGISHIDQFDKNQFNYGLGVEYKFSRIVSVNLEWQQFTTINEDTLAVENFGAQTVTTSTSTQRDITAIKLGITIYLHE